MLFTLTRKSCSLAQHPIYFVIIKPGFLILDPIFHFSSPSLKICSPLKQRAFQISLAAVYLKWEGGHLGMTVHSADLFYKLLKET